MAAQKQQQKKSEQLRNHVYNYKDKHMRPGKSTTETIIKKSQENLGLEAVEVTIIHQVPRTDLRPRITNEAAANNNNNNHHHNNNHPNHHHNQFLNHPLLHNQHK
jgi:hypothetical protein